jgi:F-type H+-transporting ATPase subunit alpha
MPVVEQAIALYVAINGYLDSIPVEEVVRFEREFLAEMRMEYAELLERLNEDKELFPETEEELKKAIVAFKEKFVS